MRAEGVSVKEMEAAAVAWTCQQVLHVPFVALKSVTDIVDGGVATQGVCVVTCQAKVDI